MLSILDPYALNGLAVEESRIEAIATISAGFKADGANNPTVSRDGRIHLHDPSDRAPGLRAALERGGSKRLTIALPWDDISLCFRSRFARYSATRLEVYGDEHGLTEIRPTKGGVERILYLPGGEDGQYEALKATCKAVHRLYFLLAEWRDGEPVIVMPDELGSLYGLRTTSRNSARSLLSTMSTVRRMTGGRLAGIPFDLTIDYRDTSGPDGTRRNVPVWVMGTKRPGGLAVSALEYRRIIMAGLRQGEQLMLAAPGDDEVTAALLVESVIDDDALMAAAEGGRADKAAYCAKFFALVRGTPLDSDEARAEFLRDYTMGEFASLKEWLEQATDAAAAAFIEHAKERVNAILTAVVAEAKESEMAWNASDAIDDLRTSWADTKDGDVSNWARTLAPVKRDGVRKAVESAVPDEPLEFLRWLFSAPALEWDKLSVGIASALGALKSQNEGRFPERLRAIDAIRREPDTF